MDKMGKTFDKIQVHVIGSFENSDKVSGWMKANGGKYHRSFNSQVTHLIVSEEVYLRNGEEIEKAKRSDKVKIVSFDWLEDSLLSRSKRPKPEQPFLWSTLLRENAKVKRTTKDPFVNRVTKTTTRRKSKDTIMPKALIFTDTAGETWDAELVRHNVAARPRGKFRVGIFQSFSNPPCYSTYAKYSQLGTSYVIELASPKKDMSLAINAFKKFFLAQTGKEWENRSNGQIPAPRLDDDGNPAPEGWYSYEDTTSLFTNWIKAYQPLAHSTEGSNKEEQA
ncbi:uncharacterized protein N7477_002585 [Penicillium maclennaniae]|uniref:uncharacterized protein n=1 Tax=Penicillium maclennaniae TaxID=1343394 RepID=UPI00253F9C74|nr:uncharacterized protein N7477_002585 [Penicillium maclennaniae]KAJ5676952.1 hypothetical protein N7477_002585 [Penicillium maclennaniae]